MPVPPDGLWGDHWEAPDALSPANGENQEGARELLEAAVKRPHTLAAYAWAHGGLAWDGGRRSKEPGRLVCVSAGPPAPSLGGRRAAGGGVYARPGYDVAHVVSVGDCFTAQSGASCRSCNGLSRKC